MIAKLKRHIIPAIMAFTAPFLAHADNMLDHKREAAVEAIHAIYAGDTEKLDTLIGEVYIQHNPSAMDGKKPLMDFVKMGREKRWFGPETAEGFKPLRIVAENNLAALHYLDQGENKVYVDIFGFGPDGKINEHWDVAQTLAAPNQSNRTMIDGQAHTKSGVSPAELKANKAAVMRLFNDFFGKNDKSAVEAVVAEDYIQHNPHGKDGRDYVITLVDRIGKNGTIPNRVHRLIADGDMVYAHVEYPLWNLAVVDIFRLKDGMIVEHWDVAQDIPAEIPHNNGMF